MCLGDCILIKRRTVTYACPVCAASMLETGAMKEDMLSEVERLKDAVDFLMLALKRVQTRPMHESAFIAAVNLQEAENRFGVRNK